MKIRVLSCMRHDSRPGESGEMPPRQDLSFVIEADTAPALIPPSLPRGALYIYLTKLHQSPETNHSNTVDTGTKGVF